jgi:hypothetical protein
VRAANAAAIPNLPLSIACYEHFTVGEILHIIVDSDIQEVCFQRSNVERNDWKCSFREATKPMIVLGALCGRSKLLVKDYIYSPQ